MSRLATVVGALSAIVSLVDYMAAKSFMSHWLQRQIGQSDDGWRISPTLNLLLVITLVAAVWMITEGPAADPAARKRQFRLRANIVVLALGAWFFLGPAIGDVEQDNASPVPTKSAATEGSRKEGHAAAETAGREIDPAIGAPGTTTPGNSPLATEPIARGPGSQFTWQRSPPASDSWRPGDGLRAVAKLLEDASTPPASPTGR